ncbi:hypothetical protein Tco_0068036 [Tanacetum coccineum]
MAITTDASLVAAQDNDNILKTQSTTMSNDHLSEEIGSGDRPRRQDTTLGDADAQTRPDTASKTSRDPPLSEVNTSRRGEDSVEYHDDLTDFVPPTPHDSPLLGVIVEDKGSGEKGGSTADQASTARPEVSATSVLVNVSAATPSTPPTTRTIFGDEDLTIAQTLVKMRSEKEKEKEKGVVLIDEEEHPRLKRSTTTL